MSKSFDTVLGDDVDTLRTRLTETIAWCSPRADIAHPRDCLRTTGLMPHPLEDGRKRVVRSVAIKRFIALGHPKPQLATNLSGGRLLIYEPDVNLAHGLEEGETDGYVDIENTPPWDTWVGYVHEREKNYLLSWVPAQFISLVTAGIRVSPEECFQWLDRQDLELAKVMREMLPG